MIGRRLWIAVALTAAGMSLAGTAPPTAPAVSAAPPAGFKLQGDAAAGKLLFAKHCALCHGESGNGRGMIKYDPPPRDLTDGKLMTPKSDWEVYRVVRDGGKPWGLSPSMLAWKGQMNEQQLQDVTRFVRSLAKPAP